MSQHLAFFEGLSLGRVSHIVQIAMTSRKLLGYKDGTIVPYARSETAVKEQCAEQQCLIKKAKSPLATWDALRTCLRELLEDAREGGFPLSNVKRILRTRFKIDLSETALGHATVSELFKDVRVQDLCSVRLLDNGYFLFPEFEVPQAPEDLATQLDALHGQSVLSTTPYLVRGSSACVHIPGASTFNSFEGMSTFAAWDLTCIALDMNPTDVYVDTPNVPQPVAHYGSGSVVFNEIEGEQNTHATKSNMSDDIVSACGSTIDSIRDSHNCDVISSSSELDLTTSESSSLPSTPRELGGVTPSPSPWNGGFFTYDLRLAIEEASDSILDSDDEAADGDSRVRVVCHANQETQWPVTEIKVKNTFIEIDCHSPMVGTSVSVARQARSLPTTPWTRLSVNGTGESELSPIVIMERECMGSENQAVFQWSAAAIDSDSTSALGARVADCGRSTLGSPQPDANFLFHWGPDVAASGSQASHPLQESHAFTIRNTFIHMPAAMSPGAEDICLSRSLPASPSFPIRQVDEQHQRMAFDANEGLPFHENRNQTHDLRKEDGHACTRALTVPFEVRFGSFDVDDAN